MWDTSYNSYAWHRFHAESAVAEENAKQIRLQDARSRALHTEQIKEV